MYGFSSIASTRSFEKGLQQETSMRDKVKEYIGELDVEIKRVERCIIDNGDDTPNVNNMLLARIQTLQEVMNDLQSRLEEVA